MEEVLHAWVTQCDHNMHSPPNATACPNTFVYSKHASRNPKHHSVWKEVAGGEVEAVVCASGVEPGWKLWKLPLLGWKRHLQSSWQLSGQFSTSTENGTSPVAPDED